MTNYEACLSDFGLYLKERALRAVEDRNRTPKGRQDFVAGRLMAFYEIVSILQQTATGLGIPLEELRLEDIVPDRDLT